MKNSGTETTPELSPRSACRRISAEARELSLRSLSFLSLMGELGAGRISSGSIYLRAFLEACLDDPSLASSDFEGICRVTAGLCSSDAEKVKSGLIYAVGELCESGAFGEDRALYSESHISERLRALAEMFSKKYEKICRGGQLTEYTKICRKFMQKVKIFISTIFDRAARKPVVY